jgi:hypothetical protein
MSEKFDTMKNEDIIPIEAEDFFRLSEHRKYLIDNLNNAGGETFFARNDIRKIIGRLESVIEDLKYISTAKIPTRNGPEPDKKLIMKAFKFAFNF